MTKFFPAILIAALCLPAGAANCEEAPKKAPTVINLASGEYWGAVDEKALDAPVIQAAFKEIKGGKGMVVSFLAKKARGMMARYAIEKGITDPEQLKEFDVDGYAFVPSESGERSWVFRRKIEA